MLKPRIYLHVIILTLIAIFACKKENEAIDKYYPHANQMDTILHDGLIRTYKLHVPTSYSAATKTALVIALHGYTSSATDFENGSRLSDKADAEDFIVAYPNGLQYPWTTSNPRAWNAGGQYEEWTQGTDDVGFIDQMIELICKYYTIDQNRIYVTGHSNGSIMTYRLGYELPCKIAAIATHSGQMVYQPTKAPVCKIPILHLHALDDGTVPYYGGLSGDLICPAVDTVLCHWAFWFSCNVQPDTTFQNSDYLIKTWSCSGDTVIKSYVLNKGGHSWFTRANSCIQANDVIWDFFKAHPKNVDYKNSRRVRTELGYLRLMKTDLFIL
jgi:polyhydroxybutyrate depolymerase